MSERQVNKSRYAICPVCGSVFFIPYVPYWKYKLHDKFVKGEGGRLKYFCKYSCMRKFQRVLELEREEKKRKKKEAAGYSAASDDANQKRSESMKKLHREAKFPGRPPMPKPQIWEKIYPALVAGDITTRIAAEKLGVSQSTVQRWKKGEQLT